MAYFTKPAVPRTLSFAIRFLRCVFTVSVLRYYNWGEPWNGGFTESMQQYRVDNQALFDRNYMPHMLGWYLLTERTKLAEMEWMLARAAGLM